MIFFSIGTLAGSPAILSVPILQPCLRAELLLVTVDTHTGMLQCHVPQYDAPLIPELTTALNGDHSRLPTLISELRYIVPISFSFFYFSFFYFSFFYFFFIFFYFLFIFFFEVIIHLR
jgi:hypothetical protein